MDCCDSKNVDKKKVDCCSDPKHEAMKDKSRKRKTMMWVIIGILLIGTIFLTIKSSSIGTAQTASSSSGKIDTSTMTADEKMNYEMHGIVPTRFQGQLSATSASTSGGAQQVGGC